MRHSSTQRTRIPVNWIFWVCLNDRRCRGTRRTLSSPTYWTVFAFWYFIQSLLVITRPDLPRVIPGYLRWFSSPTVQPRTISGAPARAVCTSLGFTSFYCPVFRPPPAALRAVESQSSPHLAWARCCGRVCREVQPVGRRARAWDSSCVAASFLSVASWLVIIQRVRL